MNTLNALVFVLSVAALTACSQGADQRKHNQTEPVESVATNFAPEELAKDVRPQDDFWSYVNARWIAQTDIPADRSAYGSFHVVADRTEGQIRQLLDTLKADPADPIGALYASFLDVAAVNAAELAPVAPLLAKIDAVERHRQIPGIMGELAALGVNGLVLHYSDNDAYDATRLLLYLWQGGLGLPNRDYYLGDNPKFVETRAAYLTYIERMLTLADVPQPQESAERIFELEEQIATLHWDAVANRDREKIYGNQYRFAEAEAAVGTFDLSAWFQGLGVRPQDKLVLAQTSYFAALGELVENQPVATWRAYMKFGVLSAMAPYLSDAIADEHFHFYGRALRGQQAQAARWKRGVRLVNQLVGELLGQAYVAEHFPEQHKNAILALVENLRAAFDVSIRELEWMSDATKTAALAKLEQFLPKLGYPDQWRDFSGLTLDAGSLVENVLRVRRFNMDYELGLLAKPVDRMLWSTTPQTVNAYYRPTHNSITFPAGILQPPFFTAQGDPAGNYGAIGAIIGHEFSHGFDDQGRKFDGVGLLNNWWTSADAEQYEERAQVLVEQYNQFKPLPDKGINGELTLGENIGDLAGVLMAYKAFEMSGLADGPEVAGLTPRQRFFVGYAVAFRSKMREPYLRELLVRDPHSPAQYRVHGVLRNVPGFYAAFGVAEDDGMYLEPAARAQRFGNARYLSRRKDTSHAMVAPDKPIASAMNAV